MHSKSRFLTGLIFGSVFTVLLLRWSISKSPKGPEIDTIVQRSYLTTKSAPLKTTTTTRPPFQDPVVGDDEDEIYYEQELERLKSSPFIYKDMPLDEQYQMSSVKTIYWYPENVKFGYSKCQYNNCKTGTNMASADIVMFIAGPMMRQLRGSGKIAIPTYTNRPKHQRWGVLSVDPWYINAKPLSKTYPELISSFNLTVSYAWHADATFFFGRLKRRTEPLTKDYGALFDKKIAMGVAVISHCPTLGRREEYLGRMKKVKGLDIQIYGRCGNKTRKDCSRHEDMYKPQICLPGLGREFKFYFAFENTFCPDYVTEKYFKLFHENIIDMIPVVRGSLDYKRYLPRDTYINAADFKTPEDLASYLIEVGSNKTLYTEMLRKKDRWVLTHPDTVNCKACELAHTHQNSTGHYDNFLHAFYGGPKNPCTKPTDLDS